jgi:hypothetical protein
MRLAAASILLRLPFYGKVSAFDVRFGPRQIDLFIFIGDLRPEAEDHFYRAGLQLASALSVIHLVCSPPLEKDSVRRALKLGTAGGHCRAV